MKGAKVLKASSIFLLGVVGSSFIVDGATANDEDNNDNDDSAVFLWSATGGGWRSMFSVIGLANVFQQAGLFDQDSSKFRSIATNSGASWFNTQLFYSDAFYNQTVMSPSPYHLYNFSLVWMSAYYEMALEAGGYRKDLIRDIVLSFLPTPQQLLGNALNSALRPRPKPDDAGEEGEDNDDEEEKEKDVEANNCQGLAGLACLFGPGESLLPSNRQQQQQRQQRFDFETDSGVNISDLIPPDSPNFDNDYNPITLLVEMYDLYRYANASWGNFMKDMMNRAAAKYVVDDTDDNNKLDFSKILANAENRIRPMSQTNMILQTTLSPQSKVRISSANTNYTETKDNYPPRSEWEYLVPIFGNVQDQDMGVFVGPLRNNQSSNTNDSIDEWEVYSVGLSAYYLVNDTFDGFSYASHDSDSTSTLATYGSPTHYHFNWNHFQGTYLAPNEGFWEFPTDPAYSMVPGKQVSQYNQMVGNMTPTGTLRPAFGGATNVIQAASVSSAFAGPASPAASVVFSQALSLIRSAFITEVEDFTTQLLLLSAYDLAVQQLYKNVLIDNGAVCSQWPKPCGPNDGYFMDGAFADNPSVVSNIAQYQNSADADLTKTIKLVLTNTNQDFIPGTYDTRSFTQYFETDFNKNISPGEFLWIPDWVNPYRSPQVFQEYLSDEDIMAAIEPMEPFNHTTAIFKGTTLNNPAFGIKEGQNVEILMINVNEANITTFIGGLKIIESLTFPLAEMVYKLAVNELLVERVREFFFDEGAANPEEGESTMAEEISMTEEDSPLQSTSSAIPKKGIPRWLLMSSVAAGVIIWGC